MNAKNLLSSVSGSSVSPPGPSAVLRGGAFSALRRLGRVFVAKKGDPRLKSRISGLETILLPAARQRWSLPYAAQMTPQMIETILRGALTSGSPHREQELYRLMEMTWPRLAKNLNEVKEAVLGLDWSLMDGAEEYQMDGARDLVERTRNGMRGDPLTDGHGWRSTLMALMDGWTRGVSVSQIEWEYREGGRRFPAAWLPRQTRDLPAHVFGWDPEGNFRLYPDGDSSRPVEVPEYEFLVAIRKAGKGHPSGGALLRPLAWWWASANFSQEWLLNFAQIFGQPFRWATYDGGQDGVKEDLAAMMEAMGSAAWGIGPEGTKVEWHEAAKSGADNPQAYLLKLADEACDLLLLGQTLTSSQGDRGSQALGTVHMDVRSDVIDSAAAWLAEILNEQLVPAIIARNFGEPGEDAALPWFQPARKNVRDAKATAEVIEILTRAGMRIPTAWAHDAMDIPQPEDGEETIGAGAAPVAGGAAADLPPEVRAVLARLPLDAREYFLARMTQTPNR
jgi:phage gp29-like protein